ncbi:MAG: hypothetical protein AABW88_03615 [Nanoarchaeota archaeon]
MADGLEKAVNAGIILSGIAMIPAGIVAMSPEHYFSASNILGYLITAGGGYLAYHGIKSINQIGELSQTSQQATQSRPTIQNGK